MAFSTWPLREEALPVAVVADGLRGGIDLRRAALVDQRVDPHGGAAAEQRFQLPFVVIDRVQRVDARHADRCRPAPDRRCRIRHRSAKRSVSAEIVRNGFTPSALGITEPSVTKSPCVHAAIAREHAAERVHRALQVIVAHRAAAQRMRRDQVPQVEHAPGGVGDEVAAQRVRVAADLLVHAREDLLLPGLVPGDADAPVGFGPRRFEQNRRRARCPAPSPGTAWSDSSRRSGRGPARWGRNRAPGGRAARLRCRSPYPARESVRRPPWRRRRRRSGRRNLRPRCAASSGSPCV